jgi:hypothetical protein
MDITAKEEKVERCVNELLRQHFELDKIWGKPLDLRAYAEEDLETAGIPSEYAGEKIYPMTFDELEKIMKTWKKPQVRTAIMRPEYKTPFQIYYLKNDWLRLYIGGDGIKIHTSEHMKDDQIWIIQEPDTITQGCILIGIIHLEKEGETDD